MKHRTFMWFILPSLAAMVLFIALPIISVFTQSLFVKHDKVLIEAEVCGPFGCKTEVSVDVAATAEIQKQKPLGKFNGFKTYTNRNHLAVKEVRSAWSEASSVAQFFGALLNLPFYKALLFTITYTFCVTPFVIVLGLFIALAVNSLPPVFKGPTIFMSLLPMIVTPLVGALILFWMTDAEGIIGSTLQRIFNDNDLSLKASKTLTWIMLMVYGIWASLPFSFIVFYAGLQTVPEDTLEAAMIDGANRWERIRYVVLPYIMPLVVFITLILLMDNFRVFEPIIGFSAQANATSLSWIIYNDLRGGEIQYFGSASATSMLTIIGVGILLVPVLIRTWRDFNAKSV